MDVDALLEQLTLEEKVVLTAGNGWWHTQTIERLGINPIRLSDGPNGVHGTHFFDSTPSACLPCGTAIGATFDAEIVKRLGGLLSDEAHAKGAHVLLGPTVNIQRSPLGGRGFESYSEDPVLSGILAGHYVNGVQASGVSAILKHYVCNDMESERMAVDAIVTERAMREIYLLPFMIAIEMGKPRAIMTSYSQLNGHHAAEKKHILQDVLRDDWKWDGLVMSDWYGTYSTSEAINAGLDLEMPGPTRWRGETLAHAVTANKVKKSVLDSAVRNILKLVKHGLENTKIPPNAPETEANTPEHIALLREAAAKSLVLLKNERNILPFDKTKKVAVIGPNATIATSCGGGSAGLRAYKTVTPLEGIKGLANDVVFSQGAYGHQSLPLLGKNLRTPDGKQKGFVLRMYNDPPAANGAADARKALEERVLDDANIWFVDYENAELNPLSWAETEGILTPERSGEWDFGLSVHGTGELYIDGKLVVSNVENQRLGNSFLGCGTVEETGRMHLEAGKDYRVLVHFGCSATSKIKPSGTNFRSDNGRVLYSEDVYVGYRWYDTLDITPLFPFGHGLSYTTFSVSDLSVSQDADKSVTVRVKVTNTGSRAGAEVVQVYVTPAAPTPLTSSIRDTITRPAKELKGFAKVTLEAGASATAEVTLDLLRATSYWAEMEDCWRSDAGKYGILVGTSSRGEFLESSISVEKTRRWSGLRA
ncbi:hypothetical protein COL922a_003633 [Colletotrichum nupharicola]|nr:hypothetical protein COL922a_003633 [Colletotrichum nupharicola]